jgi:putative ABC transport system permease protein
MNRDKWIRRVLRILPEDFRDDYGREMARVIREQERDAGTGIGLMRIWSQVIVDLLAIGPREHAAQLGQDVRYAVRGMRRQPGFVLVVVLTLALGLGANAAIFSAVQAVMLEPLPYRDPGRLVAVWNRWDGRPAATLSNPEFLDYAEQNRSMVMAAASSGAVNVVAAGGDPERVTAAFVTANALDVLGVAPALGRGFRAGEDGVGATAVAILSDGFWRRRFGADPTIVGRTIGINGVPREVIGVMPAGVPIPVEIGAITRAELLLPQTFDRGAPRSRRGGHYLQAFARLAPDATVASASAEMDGIIAGLAREYPDEHDQGNFGIVVRSLREDRLGDARSRLQVLGAIVGLVLLLASANVANLMLARGESRRREFAVRAALGAARFRILRQLLTESCVLSLVGAAAGLVVAWWCQHILRGLGGAVLPRIDQASLGTPVLVFTFGLAVVTGMLCGGLPALQVSRPGGHESLQEGARGTDASRAHVRRVLVASQVAIAVVLLVASGLLVKSFVRLTRVPSGFNADGVLTMRVSLPAASYRDRAAINGFFTRLLDRVAAVPGVDVAGAASGLPLAVASGDWSFEIEGRQRVGGGYPGAADWYVVTPGYFEALQIPIRRGRVALPSDTATAAPVVFINEQTARVLFPAEDPIGRRIRLTWTTGAEQPWRTIAGVVGDVRHNGLDKPPRTELFIPHEQFLHFSAAVQARAMTLVVRTSGEPRALAPAVRAELRAVDPEVPAAQVQDMAAVVSASVTDRRVNVTLIGAFGGLALLLAAVGVYGVMAYGVAQRTREMGVRMAMGAARGDVLRLVIREGLALTAAGAAIGVAVAFVVVGRLSGLLFAVSPRDLSVFTLAPLTLVASGLLASYIPARRATRVDPVVALRGE